MWAISNYIKSSRFCHSDVDDIKTALRRGRWTWRILLITNIILIPLTLVDVVAIKIVIDKIIVGRNSRLILPLILGFSGVFVLLILAEVFILYRAVRLSQYWDAVIKSKFLRLVLHKPLQFFYKVASGEILYRLLSDSSALPYYMTEMRWALISNVILVCSLVVLMFVYDIVLGLLVIATVPLQIVALRHVGKKCRFLQQDMKNRDEKLLGYLENVVANVETVKTFGLERLTRYQWIKQYRGRLLTERRIFVLQRILGPIVVRLTNFVILIVLGFGAYRVVIGSISVGDLMAFLVISGRIIGPAQYLASHHLNMQEIIMCLRRIRHTVSTFEDKPTNINPFLFRCSRAKREKRLEVVKDIELSNVGFRYDGRNSVFRGISWKLKPGYIYRLDGHNGSGKSTLLKLIARLLVESEGYIRINGVAAEQLSIRAIRRRLIYISSNSFWIRGTVWENIYAGIRNTHCICERDLQNCVDFTGLEDVIGRMPMGFDTVIEVGGTNLSQGEKQRLSLVRALIRQPSVLLLDEALSSISKHEIPQLLENIRIFLGHEAVIVYVYHGENLIFPNQRTVRLAEGQLYMNR